MDKAAETSPCKPRVDLTGRVFGRYTVEGDPRRAHQRETTWACVCSCGTRTRVSSHCLTAGLSRSCGCLAAEVTGDRSRTHGESGHDKRAAEYRVWLGMKGRCLNPKSPGYPGYGGRGITMCARWQGSYETFLADMGRRPSPKHSLDRIDNDKGYEPGNCRWATQREQERNKRSNRRVTFRGKTQTVTEWAEETGINFHTIKGRLNRGWSPEKALTTPVPR